MKILKYTLPMIFLIIPSAMANPVFHSHTGVSYVKPTRASFPYRVMESAPTLIGYSEDVIGYHSWGFFKAGLGGCFRWMNQLTEVNPDVGNYRGYRWEIYPAINLDFGKIDTTIGFYYWLGRYTLANKTASGSTITNKTPLGGKLFITYQMEKMSFLTNWGVSIFADYAQYSDQNDSAIGDTELESPLKVRTFGLALTIKFE